MVETSLTRQFEMCPYFVSALLSAANHEFRAILMSSSVSEGRVGALLGEEVGALLGEDEVGALLGAEVGALGEPAGRGPHASPGRRGEDLLQLAAATSGNCRMEAACPVVVATSVAVGDRPSS